MAYDLQVVLPFIPPVGRDHLFGVLPRATLLADSELALGCIISPPLGPFDKLRASSGQAEDTGETMASQTIEYSLMRPDSGTTPSFFFPWSVVPPRINRAPPSR